MMIEEGPLADDTRVPNLLSIVQGLIERTYEMRTGVRDLGRFVVGDVGLRALYGGRRVVESVGARRMSDAKVLIREADGAVFVRIYLPDRLIDALERNNPLAGLDASNLDPFAVFVEEVDHFLTLADRANGGRLVSLFELELHANVTKYATCRHFLERTLRRALDPGECRWLRWRLFELPQPPVEPSDVRNRYRDADREAARYCRHLEGLAPRRRLGELRRFHPLSAGCAVRRIELLSASA